MNTKEILAEMMGEDLEELERQEMSTLRFYPIGMEGNRYDFEAEHNLFPWLDDRLNYDERMDKFLQRYIARSGESIWDDIKKFARKVAGKRKDVNTCYSGNCDNMISHDIHFTVFERDCEEYVFLQIERPSGRMSYPRAFTTGADGSIYDFDRASLAAHDGGEPGQLMFGGGTVPIKTSIWCTDDACNWRWEGDFGERKQYGNFEDYAITKDERLCGDREHIYVDPDGIGYCPILGEPLNLSHM